MPHYEIRVWLDVVTARRAVKALAIEVGFEPRESTELAIVASELGSNIIKYGVRGSLSFERLDARDPARSGISLVARDFGPQFHDLETALKDGHDDRGPLDPMVFMSRAGIGGGLGAVLRMTHSFAVRPLVDGKEIVVERYVKPGRPGAAAPARR